MKSVPDILLRRVALSGERLAFQFPRGEGDWAQLTWRETLARVRSIASGLRAIGVKPEERCAILSSTRIEWILADLGILCAGGATTTVYPSNTPDECQFILED